MDSRWLLMVYKIPSEPSARRVYVWRKLKRLGAIVVHDAVWVLPANARNHEQFQWLAAEIVENGGEAYVWEGAELFNLQGDTLRQQFMEQVDKLYQEIWAELRTDNADLTALSRRFVQAQAQDYFQSPLGLEIREALVQAREDSAGDDMGGQAS